MPTGEVHPDVQGTIDSTRGSGTGLDAGVRSPLRGRARRRSATSRVHTDDTADQLNRSVSARAFATGTDVYFAKGEYNPGSADGDRLIAHELAHVVQQRGAASSGPLTVSQPGDALETEADAVADSIDLSVRDDDPDGRLRLRRPPRDGRGRSGSRPTTPTRPTRSAASTSPTRRALQLTRGESASGADDRLGRGHGRARARPARRRGARDLRRAGAQPALRPAVRLPAGRRHPQAAERAAGRAPARGRGRHGRRRHGCFDVDRPLRRLRRGQAARRRADAARRAPAEGRRPARRAPARRAPGRAARAGAAAARPAPRARPGPPRARGRGRRDARAPRATCRSCCAGPTPRR